MNAVIAEYYNNLKSAQKRLEEKNKIWGKGSFSILQYGKSYLILSNLQLEESGFAEKTKIEQSLDM